VPLVETELAENFVIAPFPLTRAGGSANIAG
jgi:hypothetical protein